MKLYEIIQPHTPLELTYDCLKDTTNGIATDAIIQEYTQFLITTDSTRLTSYELFSPGSIELALDKLTTLLETIPDEYIKNTKAGKMLLEMIAYFEGR
jgi:wyosine [tRNA(Phe)-imidazoG37] synthetase (radical SAM superfamily)